MPTYEYECSACGHHFELFQSITEPAARKCPACGKSKARRLISSGATIIFKGSGFYTTDYRSDEYKKRASADKPADTSAKPAESMPAESKPAGEKKSSKSDGT